MPAKSLEKSTTITKNPFGDGPEGRVLRRIRGTTQPSGPSPNRIPPVLAIFPKLKAVANGRKLMPQ
jgi:hypothetical protein